MARPDDAWALYLDMRDEGIVPHHVVATSFAHTFGRERSGLQRALDLFDDMVDSASEGQATTRLATVVIQVCMRWGDAEAAIGVCDRLLDANVPLDDRLLSTIMKGLTDCGMWARALDLYENCRQQGTVLFPGASCQYLRALAAGRDLDAAFRVFKVLLHESPDRDSQLEALNSMLRACILYGSAHDQKKNIPKLLTHPNPLRSGSKKIVETDDQENTKPHESGAALTMASEEEKETTKQRRLEAADMANNVVKIAQKRYKMLLNAASLSFLMETIIAARRPHAAVKSFHTHCEYGVIPDVWVFRQLLTARVHAVRKAGPRDSQDKASGSEGHQGSRRSHSPSSQSPLSSSSSPISSPPSSASSQSSPSPPPPSSLSSSSSSSSSSPSSQAPLPPFSPSSSEFLAASRYILERAGEMGILLEFQAYRAIVLELLKTPRPLDLVPDLVPLTLDVVSNAAAHGTAVYGEFPQDSVCRLLKVLTQRTPEEKHAHMAMAVYNRIEEVGIEPSVMLATQAVRACVSLDDMARVLHLLERLESDGRVDARVYSTALMQCSTPDAASLIVSRFATTRRTPRSIDLFALLRLASRLGDVTAVRPLIDQVVSLGARPDASAVGVVKLLVESERTSPLEREWLSGLVGGNGKR